MVPHWLLILTLLGSGAGESVSVGSHFGPQEIRRIPGAAEGPAAVTALTNTAWLSQEHLHLRGGHQVSYRLDGVEVPDLSLFRAITPFVDPRNFRAVEVTTGGLPAEFGNRTSGVVDAVARSGFDEVGGHGLLEAATRGFGQRSLFGSYGDHFGERFAFYLQALALGSSRGFNPPPDSLDLPEALRPPSSQTRHNDRSTWQGFGNLEYRSTSQNQRKALAGGSRDKRRQPGCCRPAPWRWFGPADRFRLAFGAYRTDLQIPNTLDQQKAGRDYRQRERDRFLHLNWTHATDAKRLLSVSLFHHSNALRVGGIQPFAEDDRRAAYNGVRAAWGWPRGRHLLKAGAETYRAGVRDAFSTEGFLASASDLPTTGWEHSAFLQDQFNATDRLTLHLGARLDHFRARNLHSYFSPRLGFAYRLGNSHAAVFGSYNWLFLPPPLEHIALPNFDAVRPERDRQYDLGVKFLLRGFQVRVNRWSKRQEVFLDHLQFGENNIFLAVNLERGRTHGLEAAVAAPRRRGLAARFQYSLSYAQARGGVLHGYRDFQPRPGWFFLDHDQRHAVTVMATAAASRTRAVSACPRTRLSIFLCSKCLPRSWRPAWKWRTSSTRSILSTWPASSTAATTPMPRRALVRVSWVF